MRISIDFINGIALGVELVQYDEDNLTKTLIVDIVMLRILIQW